MGEEFTFDLKTGFFGEGLFVWGEEFTVDFKHGSMG